MKNCFAYIKAVFFRDAYSDLLAWKKLRKKIIGSRNDSFANRIRKLKYNTIMSRNSSWISLSTELGENTSFPHGLSGIFCSAGAVIGDNCTILQHVTIGSNTLSGSNHIGAPRIGNNVFIGAGATIIGGITIGDNVRIGANAIIYKDVPSNCTVVSNSEMKIIMHDSVRENNYCSFSAFNDEKKK